MLERLGLDTAAIYEICFQGTIEQSWAERLAPEFALQMQAVGHGAPTTTLTGRVTDQAALIGLLNSFYGLGLPLLSVKRLL